VVIQNEKKENDAALTEAVKNFWKAGPYKFMSELEFTEKFKAGTLDKANLYLFNNISTIYQPSRPKASATGYFTGFFLTNSPVDLVNTVKIKKAPAFLYFSQNALFDTKNKAIKGFYELMVKNFNHEVLYCQDAAHFKKHKLKVKRGVAYFAPDSLADKTVLLVKEQTQKKEKAKKDDSKKKQKELKKTVLVTDRFTGVKKPLIVFPEDIDYAVKTSDHNIMLYNGGNLYSSVDGSIYASSFKYPSRRNMNLYSIGSLVFSVATIIWFKNNIKSQAN
jgi:hypothetical protein